MAGQFGALRDAYFGAKVLHDFRPWDSLTRWAPGIALRSQLATVPSSDFPQSYRNLYAVPLASATGEVTSALNQWFKRRLAEGYDYESALADTRLRADCLYGAVRDWDNKSDIQSLIRFQAVVDDIYGSFINGKQQPDGYQSGGAAPPLVTFTPEPRLAPFTMHIDMVHQYCSNAKAGVVALPRLYKDQPLFWGVLGHETGGHDVAHAIPDLIKEVTIGISRMTSIKSESKRKIWTFWADEIIADVFGVLNIGPAFAVSLGACLAAYRPDKMLGREIGFWNDLPLDEHPLDVLRMSVARGVTGSLTSLNDKTKANWIAEIDDAINVGTGGDINRGTWNGTPIDLTEYKDNAIAIGHYIATTKLTALGGQSIQAIETWCDKDEAIAGTVKDAALGTGSLSRQQLGADHAQLLAGATMALAEYPSRYASLSQRLFDALA
jgi:hypothetical protein